MEHSDGAHTALEGKGGRPCFPATAEGVQGAGRAAVWDRGMRGGRRRGAWGRRLADVGWTAAQQRPWACPSPCRPPSASPCRPSGLPCPPLACPCPGASVRQCPRPRGCATALGQPRGIRALAAGDWGRHGRGRARAGRPPHRPRCWRAPPRRTPRLTIGGGRALPNTPVRKRRRYASCPLRHTAPNRGLWGPVMEVVCGGIGGRALSGAMLQPSHNTGLYAHPSPPPPPITRQRTRNTKQEMPAQARAYLNHVWGGGGVISGTHPQRLLANRQPHKCSTPARGGGGLLGTHAPTHAATHPPAIGKIPY